MNADLYYFRDQSGFEIDLVSSQQRRLRPYEIKSARSYHPEFFRSLKRFLQWSDRIDPGGVLYSREQSQTIGDHALIPFEGTASIFDKPNVASEG